MQKSLRQLRDTPWPARDVANLVSDKQACNSSLRMRLRKLRTELGKGGKKHCVGSSGDMPPEVILARNRVLLFAKPSKLRGAACSQHARTAARSLLRTLALRAVGLTRWPARCLSVRRALSAASLGH